MWILVSMSQLCNRDRHLQVIRLLSDVIEIQADSGEKNDAHEEFLWKRMIQKVGRVKRRGVCGKKRLIIFQDSNAGEIRNALKC